MWTNLFVGFDNILLSCTGTRPGIAEPVRDLLQIIEKELPLALARPFVIPLIRRNDVPALKCQKI